MNCFLSISLCSIFYILMVSNSVLCKTQKVEKVAEVTEVSAAVSMKDTCETLPSTIQVTKEEYDDLGNVVRSCEGTIGVTKCEGSCNSQIQPSVVTPTGFLKDCHCCRETLMRQQEVLLTDCYTQDGKRIFGQQGTMDCHCCRETWMRQREILLTDCYTQDGKRIFGQQGTMVIHLKEPEACACHKCGL